MLFRSFQAAQTKSLEALLRLEGNPKSRTKDGATILDVASIVMADNDYQQTQDDNQDGEQETAR